MALRSPLLQAYPTHQDPQRAARLRKRIGIIFLLLLLMLLPVSIVVSRMAPTNGWGYPLYWVHDNIYLSLKGYLFYNLGSFRRPIWLALIVFAVVRLYYYLNAQPMTRLLHMFLLEKVLRQPKFYPLLLKGAHLLTKWGYLSTLTAEACSSHRRRCLEGLMTQPSNKALINKLYHITHLELALRDLNADHTSALHGLKAWRDCLFFFKDQSSFFSKQEHQRLVDLVLPLILRLSQVTSPGQLIQNRNAPLFSMEAVALDHAHLAAMVRPELSKVLYPELQLSPPGDGPLIAMQRLSHSVNLRDEKLDELRISLENHWLYQQSYQENQLLPPDMEAEHGKVLGQAVLDLAIVSAQLNNDAFAATKFIESYEALHLALSFYPEPPPEAVDQLGEVLVLQDFVELNAFLEQLPQPLHYTICAQLSERYTTARLQTFEASHLKRNQFLNQEDFAEEQWWSVDMLHAAGPDFVPHGETL